MPQSIHANGSTVSPHADRTSAPTDRTPPPGDPWGALATPAATTTTAAKRSRLRRIPRMVRINAGCLAVAAGVTLLVRVLWPEVEPLIAVGFGAVFFAGLVLWWGNRRDTAAESTLGAAILAGTLVTIAVFGIQSDLDAQRQLAAEQQALRLTLGLQQDLSGIDLSERDLTSFYLRGKNLTQAVLAGADLTDVNLAGSQLAEVDLTGADVSGARLDGGNLSTANLTRADLTRTDLFNADLSEALLRDADLSGAFLTTANLSNALLAGADLRGADLSGANLDGAILDGAIVNAETLWPEGYDWRAAGVRGR